MEFNDNAALRRQFAKRLKEKMKERDLSAPELSRKLNTTRQRIAQWLDGQALPNLPAARQLAILFGVSLDYFACVPHNRCP